MPLLAIEIEWRMLAGAVNNSERGTGFFLTCFLVCCIGYAIHLFTTAVLLAATL